MNPDFRKTDPSYPEPVLSENAITVLNDRYLEKNEKGDLIETPKDMFYRVAAATASAENLYASGDEAKWRRTYYDMMAKGEFLPNSPTLMNAGRNENLLSACFVLPINDSIDGIFDTVKETAIIQKAGGGTGFSFDELRPTGDYIASSGGTTSGPISFWKVLSEATNAIQQGAFRRGANMGMMSVHHPDILKFIVAKRDKELFTNYNVSIKVTNKWMSLVRDSLKDSAGDTVHVVENFRTGKKYLIPRKLVDKSKIMVSINTEDYVKPEQPKYELKDLVLFEEGKAYAKDSFWTVKDIFDIISFCAWDNGEPGLIFIDEMNAKNPTPHIGRIEATNPCGEQPLLPHEACNLGSINLVKFVVDGVLQEAAFVEAVHNSVRFLDDIIDINPYPIPAIDKICKENRKIGLGLMGFADMLYMMGIPYNSEEGVKMGEYIMKLLNDEALNASENLAVERGNFANYEGSIFDGVRPMRNSAATTIAPTGTISIIADCSGGMEPLFSLVFYRQVLGGKTLKQVHVDFEKVAKEKGFYSEDLAELIATEGTIAHMEGIPQEVKDVYVCTHDITPEWHVKMQAAFQRHCASSISKTINFTNSGTVEQVVEAYMLAWENGCKGITVYRDGCRSMQPMALKKKESAPKVLEKPVDKNGRRRPIKTPDIASSVRIRQNTPFGHMHVTVAVDIETGHELEVFAQLGKAGDVLTADLEAISRLSSMYLRMDGDLNDVIDQLKGIGSSTNIPTKEGNVGSLADALAKALEKYKNAKSNGLEKLLMGELSQEELHRKPGISSVGKTSKKEKSVLGQKDKCPNCGAPLAYREKCLECSARCGYSKCGG